MFENYDHVKWETAFGKTPGYARYLRRKRVILDRIIQLSLEKILETHPIFQSLKVEQSADQTARYLASRASEMAESSIEISMAACRKVGKGLIVQRMELYDAQAVNDRACHDVPMGKIVTAHKLKQEGYEIFGWTHSHGLFPREYSSTDISRARKDVKAAPWITCTDGRNTYELQYFPMLLYSQDMQNSLPTGMLALRYKTWNGWRTRIRRNIPVKIIGKEKRLDTKALDDALLQQVHVMPSHISPYDTSKYYDGEFFKGRSLVK